MADKTKLTDKQEKFVQELLKGKTQREAYKRAFNPPNTCDEAIDVNACKMFNTAKVKQRYNTLHDKLIAKSEEKAIVDATFVLQGLKDVYQRCMDEIPVKDNKGMETGEWKFEPAGANKSLELLGKYLKLFTDKLEHTGKDGGAIQMDINKYTDEEIDKMLKDLGYKKDPS